MLWKLAWPKLAVPKGIHVGPIIKGKNRSVGVPKELRAGGFDFPLRPGHVNAVVKPTPMVGEKVRLHYRVDGPTDVKFRPKERLDGVGTVSLMLQRKGDDYSGKGEKAFYRLYGPEVHDLSVGLHTLEVAPGSLGWVGVMGQEPSPGQWDDVLSNLAAIHVCFGEKDGPRAHGVLSLIHI